MEKPTLSDTLSGRSVMIVLEAAVIMAETATPEAEARRETFRDLPELFTRAKDYSRGIGVMDLAKAIETGGKNRASGEMIIHITEAIEGLATSAETGAVWRMRTTCEQPEPLRPGCALDEV